MSEIEESDGHPPMRIAFNPLVDGATSSQEPVGTVAGRLFRYEDHLSLPESPPQTIASITVKFLNGGFNQAGGDNAAGEGDTPDNGELSYQDEVWIRTNILFNSFIR